MVTVGRILHCFSGFFRSRRRHCSKPTRPNFWGLAMTVAMGAERTIERLNALRRGDRKAMAWVMNDLAQPARKVVGDCLGRWATELLIKDEKQHLGLGAYRILRYRAIVRHLQPVDRAFACLTHPEMEAQGEQGRKNKETVLGLPPIRQLKAELRQATWNEAVTDVVKVSHERPVIRRVEKLLAA